MDLSSDSHKLLEPYKGFGHERQIISSGIDSFDEILGGGLKSGYLYDICGLSGSGKTQLCNSIAINLAINHNYETLYVDAKMDFSGRRIYNILNARNCSDDDCGSVMNSIRCESIYDFHEFLKILRETVPEHLERHSQAKCLIVDSLPALYFPLMNCGGHHDLSLLCEATNLMQKIAFKHNIIILVINIVTRKTEAIQDPADHSKRFQTKLTVAMGKYWRSVPWQRFLLKRIDASNSQSSGKRIIEIMDRTGKGKTCTVQITNKGVISTT